jgi:hypothetical protein
MPNGECNITTPVDNLTVPNPIQENAHIIATFNSPHYGPARRRPYRPYFLIDAAAPTRVGTHVLVRGRDTKIYHKHQIAPDPGANWTAWKCLTPDLATIPCSTAPHCGGYDNAPAVAWQPGAGKFNGTAVVFMRQIGDLDLHETHLEDPTNPDSWSPIRAPACICNYPPCANQTKCGVAECDAKGVDCSKHPTSSRQYWSYGTFFPTSEVTLLVEDRKLAMRAARARALRAARPPDRPTAPGTTAASTAATTSPCRSGRATPAASSPTRRRASAASTTTPTRSSSRPPYLLTRPNPTD